MSDRVKERLLRQLAYFEENSQDILNGFTHTAERAAIKDLIARYCRHIERQVGDLDAEGPDALVWIGSRVTVYNETDQAEECFIIVLPEEVDPDEGKISFLSPIGQKLLLTRAGSRAEIDSPGGKYWVTVKDLAFGA
jgi:transcription elongation GreA/GreB family factor